MNKLLLIAVTMLVFVSPAHAGQVTQGGLKVTKIMTGYSGGEAFLVIDKTPLNPNDCSATTSTSKTLAVDPSKSDVDQVISVLLTAFTSGKDVEVQIYDNSCFNGHAVIRRVAIY